MTTTIVTMFISPLPAPRRWWWRRWCWCDDDDDIHILIDSWSSDHCFIQVPITHPKTGTTKNKVTAFIVERAFGGVTRYILYSLLKTSFPCRYRPISAESRHCRPVGAGNAYTPARASFVGDAYTPANETADLVSLNMAAPVRTVSDIRDNPKTLNRSGVYIHNDCSPFPPLSLSPIIDVGCLHLSHISSRIFHLQYFKPG